PCPSTSACRRLILDGDTQKCWDEEVTANLEEIDAICYAANWTPRAGWGQAADAQGAVMQTDIRDMFELVRGTFDMCGAALPGRSLPAQIVGATDLELAGLLVQIRDDIKLVRDEVEILSNYLECA